MITRESMRFTFSDLIAGYVKSADIPSGQFTMETVDGREFIVTLTDAAYQEVARNLGEPWQDPGAPMEQTIIPGKFLFVYGVYYPEERGTSFEAKHIVFVGRTINEWRFESPEWWITQIRALAEFYLNAQFGDGVIDFRNYRTHLTLEGTRLHSMRQETDTMSRMIYGFASAYMLTGEDRYLEAAEKGTEYLREHMRAIDEEEGIAYWYHAMELRGNHEAKILASEFGDDYEAIPAYEQIYALAGPIQTYRATGDPRILDDAQKTVALFERFYKDEQLGGYFSHLDPIELNPRDESLTHNRARKNWNSVGDHAPAYLINLYLATGDQQYADMLAYCADMVEQHFPDYDNSPFVNEKFMEDWSHDLNSPLQKNRAIVGHNLKIAWNLMRIYHLIPEERYRALAEKIGEVMPEVGMDKQRLGWYDMVERFRRPGEEFHRLIWHDRKAWWQQEQGILAYLILAGSLKHPQYLKLARESSAFYNAWFPDNDSGGVYFNVLANGIPYLLGNERLKGSHSMSGYHSFELCYLAAVYSNLLITKQPMDFYFKPQPGSLKDGILRVAPDLLPPGSIRLEAVWINGERYADFNANELTIKLPVTETQSHPLDARPAWMGNPRLLPKTSQQEMRVKVRIVPAGVHADMELTVSHGSAVLVFEGTLHHDDLVSLEMHLTDMVAAHPRRAVFNMQDLKGISDECTRALAFMRERMGADTEVYVVAPNEEVKHALQVVGILGGVTVLEDPAQVGAAQPVS